MNQTSITLLICIAAELILLSTAAANAREQKKANRPLRKADYISLCFGVPFLVFTAGALAVEIFH